MIAKTEGAAAALEAIAEVFDASYKESVAAVPPGLRPLLRDAQRLIDAVEQVAFAIRTGDPRHLKEHERSLYDAVQRRLTRGRG